MKFVAATWSLINAGNVFKVKYLLKGHEDHYINSNRLLLRITYRVKHIMLKSQTRFVFTVLWNRTKL